MRSAISLHDSSDPAVSSHQARPGYRHYHHDGQLPNRHPRFPQSQQTIPPEADRTDRRRELRYLLCEVPTVLPSTGHARFSIPYGLRYGVSRNGYRNHKDGVGRADKARLECRAGLILSLSLSRERSPIYPFIVDNERGLPSSSFRKRISSRIEVGFMLFLPLTHSPLHFQLPISTSQCPEPHPTRFRCLVLSSPGTWDPHAGIIVGFLGPS